jgi:hypothetical protein
MRIMLWRSMVSWCRCGRSSSRLPQRLALHGADLDAGALAGIRGASAGREPSDNVLVGEADGGGPSWTERRAG